MTSIWINRWRRLRQRRWILAEAVIAIAAASAAVRLLPFKHAVRLGSWKLRPAYPSDIADDVRWAVEAAARKVPWRAVCFQQGLALQWMLRRRGVDALLHYGIRKDEEGELEAHVWVSADGQVIIGGGEASSFQRVATYP